MALRNRSCSGASGTLDEDVYGSNLCLRSSGEHCNGHLDGRKCGCAPGTDDVLGVCMVLDDFGDNHEDVGRRGAI